MSRPLQEYHDRWQQAMQQGNLSEMVEDPELTEESCVIFETAHSSPMGEGMSALPDFGDAICYYRYFRVVEELGPREYSTNVDVILPLGLEILQKRWENRRPNLSEDEIQARHDTAVKDLDELLERFVRLGYQPEMKKRLKEIVNYALVEFELDTLYVLPGDLGAILSSLGNPLADYDRYETEEAAEAHTPAFDLSNPEHREALKERIFMVGR